MYKMYKVIFPLLLIAVTATKGFGQRAYDAIPLPGPDGPKSFYYPRWSNDDGSKMIGRTFFPFGVAGSSGSTGQCYKYENGAFAPLATPGFDCEIEVANVNGAFAGILVVNGFDAASNTNTESWYAYGYLNGEFVPFKSLLPSQSDHSQANGINSKGDIVGSANADPFTVSYPSPAPSGGMFSYVDYKTVYGFVYSGGQVLRLPTLGGHLSIAHSINDAGDVAGTASLPKNDEVRPYLEPARAVLFRGGQIVDLGLPQDTNSSALLINNKGQVAGDVGKSVQPDGTTVPGHLFFLDGTNISTIPIPAGATEAPPRPTQMNDAGEVIGIYQTPDFPQKPFYYYKGKSYDLNSLVRNLPAGVILAAVSYLSPEGNIVALAKFAGDPSLAPAGAYLLKPVAPLADDTTGGDPGQQQTGSGSDPSAAADLSSATLGNVRQAAQSR